MGVVVVLLVGRRWWRGVHKRLLATRTVFIPLPGVTVLVGVARKAWDKKGCRWWRAGSGVGPVKAVSHGGAGGLMLCGVGVQQMEQ